MGRNLLPQLGLSDEQLQLALPPTSMHWSGRHPHLRMSQLLAVQPMSRPFTVSLTSMLPLVALEYGHT